MAQNYLWLVNKNAMAPGRLGLIETRSIKKDPIEAAPASLKLALEMFLFDHPRLGNRGHSLGKKSHRLAIEKLMIEGFEVKFCIQEESRD
jgi:hypothetical protein